MIAGQIGLGLALGLALTELAFAARDQHAFPHVNFYVPDPELGVRLRPGASMAFKLGDNPLTHIHVNSQGYRGGEWPPAAAAGGEVLVVGDSQVFGLGVDDDETFSTLLSARLAGKTVLNAGVPTYGPPEYLAVTRELLEEREIDTVVYVLNFLNDPFELERPNRERHAIWDGWAVRIETAPDPGEILDFPGRRWLMSQSHAVYAARRWWHSRDEAWFEAVDRGLPSEGDFEDLLAEHERGELPVEVAEPEPEPEPKPSQAAPEDDENEARAADLAERLAKLDARLERAEAEVAEHRFSGRDRQILESRPGGIIRDRYSESARSIEVTAELYQAALERRRRHKEALAKRRQIERRRDKLRTELEHLSEAEAQATPPPPPEPEPEPEPEPPPSSVFTSHLIELQELCSEHDARLVVVMLPFDVQVSSEEWLAYGVEDGPDMSPTLVLLEDAVASAEQRGITALNATEALRAAEPGAFLDADIHMTPKGHAALAEALAQTLEQVAAEASGAKSKSSPSPS